MSKSFNISAILAGVAFAALSLSTSVALADDVSQHPAALRFRPYVSVFAGGSLPNPADTAWSDDFRATANFNLDKGWLAGVAFGVKWNDLLRTELEFNHTQWAAINNVDSHYPTFTGHYSGNGAVSANYLLGNLWADVKTNSALTPYFGGGVGVAFVGSKGVQYNTWGAIFSDTYQTQLAWQLGVGLKFNFSEHVALDIGYRFKSIENLQFINSVQVADSFNNGRLSSHNIEAGLTFTF